MERKLNILHLEDNRLDSELVRILLSRLELIETYTLVDKRNEFIEAFSGKLPDLLISDINVPDFSGFEAVAWITQKHPIIPVIIVTGSIDEETAAKTIQLGAWDYVVKERLHRLPPAIENVLKLKEEREKSFRAKKLADNILQTTPSAVFTVDTDKVITSWNKMAESITGYSAEVMVGQSCMMLGSNVCAHSCALFDTSRKPGPVLNTECDLINFKGDRKYILKNADLLHNERGEVIGGIESFVDQSEIVQITKDLVLAKENAEESDKLKSAFLANISHEIRTPLNAIIGFTDLVIDPDTEDSDKKDYTNIIKTGSDQLLSILNNILQLSLIEAGQVALDIQEFEVSSLFQEMHAMWLGSIEDNGIILELDSNESIIMTSDRSRLGLVINNLLENAEKFTKSGKINFGYRQNGNKVLFFVSDTGKGIPESIGDKVFERFYRISDPAHITRGSGLGLPISKANIEALGGAIWHEPNEKHGTTFFFEIPMESNR